MNKLREMALEKVVGLESIEASPDDGKAEMREALAEWKTYNRHAIELADLDPGLDRAWVERIINRLYNATGACWYEEGLRDGMRLVMDMLGMHSAHADATQS